MGWGGGGGGGEREDVLGRGGIPVDGGVVFGSRGK